jgi:hypothetical protein
VNSWRLIAPAEDWSQPLEIDESVLPVLAEVARRLELRITRDDGQKKLYLGLPQEVPASVGSDILYPSGKRLSLAQLSEAEAARYGTTGSYQAAPLVVAKIEDKLSEHFRAGEFFAHDPSYRYLRVSPELVEAAGADPQSAGGAGGDHSLGLPTPGLQPEDWRGFHQYSHRRPGRRHFRGRHLYRAPPPGL